MKRIHQLFTLALFIPLAGCVGVSAMMGKHLNAYEGLDRDDSEVATILQAPARASDMAAVSVVDGITYGDRTWRGFPSIVKVLEGEHTIIAMCLFGRREYAYPSVRSTFRAGKTYELSCRKMGDDHASAFIREVDGTAVH